MKLIGKKNIRFRLFIIALLGLTVLSVFNAFGNEKYNMPGNTLIVFSNGHVVEITMDKKIVWEYKFKPIKGTYLPPLPSKEKFPPRPIESAIRLPSGNTLISETGNHRIVKVNKNGQIVWQYGVSGQFGNITGYLYSPSIASPTINGNILISDRLNYRILEVTKRGDIIWKFDSEVPPGGKYKLPTEYLKWKKHLEPLGSGFIDPNTERRSFIFFWAVSLNNGNVLFQDRYNEKLIEMDKRKKIVWSELCANFPDYLIFRDKSSNYMTKKQCLLEIEPQGYMKWAKGEPWGLSGRGIHAFRIKEGHVLLFVRAVYELDEKGKTIWEYKGDGKTTLCPVFAQRIGNVPLTEILR